MRDEYYKYIDTSLLARADHYYVNGYYSDAVLYYRKAADKAARYAGDRMAIIMAACTIEGQLQKAMDKAKDQAPYGNPAPRPPYASTHLGRPFAAPFSSPLPAPPGIYTLAYPLSLHDALPFYGYREYGMGTLCFCR